MSQPENNNNNNQESPQVIAKIAISGFKSLVEECTIEVYITLVQSR